MDEGRKRVLLIAAAILAARKLATWDGKPSPALESAITDAVTLAEWILKKGRFKTILDTGQRVPPSANLAEADNWNAAAVAKISI